MIHAVLRYLLFKFHTDVKEVCACVPGVRETAAFTAEHRNTFNRECTEETRKKISESLKNAGLRGILKSEETKKRMRKPKSKLHVMKIKEAQRKVIKTVYQYSMNMEYLDTYESVSDAARQTNIQRKDISANCNNKQKSAHGFIWSFKKEVRNDT